MVLSTMREYHAGRIKLGHTEQTLKAIENFHFIFTAITSQRSSGGISLMYALHARELLNGNNLQNKLKGLKRLRVKLVAKLPQFAEFESNFAELRYSEEFTKQKRLVQYVLAKVWEYLSNGVVVDYEQMTIEHLASQNPAPGVFVPPTDVASIGNLVLVDSALNEKLANRSFKEKKALLAKSHVPLDETIKTATNWGSKEIHERTEQLAKLAFNKIWQIT